VVWRCRGRTARTRSIEIRELFGMVALGEHVLHTAHQIKTARKAFKRILSFFENERQYPELVEMVKEIRQTNGQEAIVLTNGGSIEFVARTRSSGRGFAGIDLLIFDEAQDLDDDAVEALQPTTAAASLGNPQTIFTGTPPNPDLNQTGGVFIRIRARGAAGIDPRMCWHDYGVADGRLPDITDRAVWLQTNPGMPHRLGVSEVETEFSMLTAEGFARERLGWWGEPGSSDSDIDPSVWRERADTDAVVNGARALGLDVTLDQSKAAIAGAGLAGGGCTSSRSSHQKGTGWVVEAAVDLQAGIPASCWSWTSAPPRRR
jgi:hypothetical protein